MVSIENNLFESIILDELIRVGRVEASQAFELIISMVKPRTRKRSTKWETKQRLIAFHYS